MPVATKRAESRSRYYTRDEARRLGWNVRHPSQGGNFLEEQELVDYFPSLRDSIGLDRPDFAVLGPDGNLCAVIECKNEFEKLEDASKEAIEYANSINRVKGFNVHVAVGVAGTPDKFVQTRCYYLRGTSWVPLTSHGYTLTQLPTCSEVEIAVANDDGTTDVQLPDEREFFDAAIAISRILRDAKIEEPARPKVIGAIVLALYHGEFSHKPDMVLESINLNVSTAIAGLTDVDPRRRELLTKTLELSTESHLLRPRIPEVVHQLERLNVRSIMRSGVDFLGQFYEAFLRYGGSAKNLGIVFTPRHITRFCAEIVDVRVGMKVYDPACGTGGFLVAAFDRMMNAATTAKAKRQVRDSLYGFDTNPTVWALAMLNLFFRGDGKSKLDFRSCFDSPQLPNGKFDCVLLNPPYSQMAEPEVMFIDHALSKLKPGGELAVVVKTSIAVDDAWGSWRSALVENHHVLAVISMPAELFYPTGAPTVIMVIRAHTPDKNLGTFVARVQNDGFAISKNRRIPVDGSQLPLIGDLFAEFRRKQTVEAIPGVACVVSRDTIRGGAEICAERWLPSATFGMSEFEDHRRALVRQMSMAIVKYPDATEELIEDYDEQLAIGDVPSLRPKKRTTLNEWFELSYGLTTAASDMPAGTIPYVSSSDSDNGIVGLLAPPPEEVIDYPCITITGFGAAYVQPWRFIARGGAGSAVRIAKPRFAMTMAELFWFAGQINAERWRIYYGRMINLGRLKHYACDPPPSNLPLIAGLHNALRRFRGGLDEFSALSPATTGLAERFGAMVKAWKAGRGPTSSAAKMAEHPAYAQIIGLGQTAVPLLLKELHREPDHWFVALHKITGENPIPKKDAGNVRAMARAWVEWGKSKGMIDDAGDVVS